MHFKLFAPEPKEYAPEPLQLRGRAPLEPVNDHLATRTWMLGDTYTLVDMAVWGWARMIPRAMGVEAWDKLPHEAAPGRHQCPAGRAAGRGAEGAFCLQAGL